MEYIIICGWGRDRPQSNVNLCEAKPLNALPFMNIADDKIWETFLKETELAVGSHSLTQIAENGQLLKWKMEQLNHYSM